MERRDKDFIDYYSSILAVACIMLSMLLVAALAFFWIGTL